ncbi:Yip1 family protein [Methanoplanus endosymbiosus]|uniref:YIP1 family protein n=1 Tax=Methanoplanus endosymbiosus TaxID=33865 RepID=A0A9E7PNZ6_9EURY|nr:Yip1 family protein [Methanoplanus endosymbiosus]UUX93783.1 YIP1 family protein [Methanoplanus endosymbiosus]
MIPIKEIILSPKSFFDGLCNQPESLGKPFLVISILGLISGISAAIVSQKSAGLLPAEAQFMAGILPVIGFVGAVIMTYIIWLLWSVVFFVISSLLKGEGSFKRMMEITGYGSVPQIIGGIFSAIITVYYMSGLDIRPITDPTQIEAYTQTLMADPMMIAAAFIGIIFLLWSANIWIFGVMKCRKLDFKKSVITVLLPVIIYIIIFDLPLIGM